jgi:hypothetical protein
LDAEIARKLVDAVEETFCEAKPFRDLIGAAPKPYMESLRQAAARSLQKQYAHEHYRKYPPVDEGY